MKYLTLTAVDFERLNLIKIQLRDKRPFSKSQEEYLLNFIDQVNTSEADLLAPVPFDQPIGIQLWDVMRIEEVLLKWSDLFHNIPGFDFTPAVNVIDQNSNVELIRKNVIMTAGFCPSLSRNESAEGEAFEVHLMDDGMASFWFPTFEDAKNYPELFNFKGTWKEAYYLLIETLKKGWPMEEFPEELQQFLKK